MRDSLKLLDEIRQNKVESTIPELEGFVGSDVHKDFINELIARMELMKDYYLDCTYEEFLETRGGLKALELTIPIFETLLENRVQDAINIEEIEDDKEI